MISGHAAVVVPWTTSSGMSSFVMGVSRPSDSTLIEWPWFARMRKLRGSESSWVAASFVAEAASSAVVESLAEAVETGMSEKRCLSFSATMVRSSGKVTLRDLRMRVWSWIMLRKGVGEGTL